MIAHIDSPIVDTRASLIARGLIIPRPELASAILDARSSMHAPTFGAIPSTPWYANTPRLALDIHGKRAAAATIAGNDSGEYPTPDCDSVAEDWSDSNAQ